MYNFMTMGAENSSFPAHSWKLDSTGAYETDCWELKNGTSTFGFRISVFSSKKQVHDKRSLEQSEKHLRKLRHPYILKHVTSYCEKGRFFLVTEEVTPLDVLMSEQKLGLLEITSGLINVLKALEFVHNQCQGVHNNLHTGAIFVNVSQSWKLAGFESMTLQSTLKNGDRAKLCADDIRAFCDLAFHLLKDNKEPEVQAFLERIQEEILKGQSVQKLTCKDLLQDPVFGNDFLIVRLFLENIILKTPEEKESFFKSLVPRLRLFIPEMVASHLVPLLLSRVVILDQNAIKLVLPFILRPNDPSCEQIFSTEIFRQCVVPHLLNIFTVHDRHTRLALMEHFSYYVHLFTKEQLIESVLPQVLLGIKDVNDDVVSASLHALAHLVSLLGAETVVGKNRTKVFSEGSPRTRALEAPNVLQKKKSTVKVLADALPITSKNSSITNGEISSVIVDEEENASTLNLGTLRLATNAVRSAPEAPPIPERSSPDGGESVSDNTNWSDWEDDVIPLPSSPDKNESIPGTEETLNGTFPETDLQKSEEATNQIAAPTGFKITPGLGEEFDIMAIDIKLPAIQKADSVDDFFADMEPTIVTKNSLLVPNYEIADTNVKSKFQAIEDCQQDVVGWDDSELNVDIPE